ncbi:MAG: T9SS type A sorting domain-containing protein [Saprospiraceae bacterium]|nr:T9SS type A sorting domain-containing protein [Saprospiraceae bacterium]
MKNVHIFHKINKLLQGLVALLLLVPWSFCAGQGSWAELNDMPVIKNHHSSISYNGKIYLFGGGVGAQDCTTEVWEYDPLTDTYTAKAPMPAGICEAAVAEYNGKIYLFGGYLIFGQLFTNWVFEYDVAYNSWSQKESLATAKSCTGAATLNDKIYLIGGGILGGTGLTTVDIYDPVTDDWSSGPSLPVQKTSITAHTINGKIYVVGGTSSTSVAPTATTLVFDPEIGSWNTVSPIPTPRILHSSSVVDNKIFVMGGLRHIPMLPVYSSVEMYDPELDQWITNITPMPTPRRCFSASAYGGKIYVFGGNNQTSGFFRSVDLFDPGNLVPVFDRVAPKGVMLAQNSPNPFSDATDISFTVTLSGYVNLSLIDMSGRVLLTLISENLTPGTYDYFLDARNLAPGTYFYRLQVDGDTPEVRKMVVVK